MKNKSTKKKKISVVALIIIIIAAGVFCFSGYKLISIMANYNVSKTSYDNLRDILTVGSKDDPSGSDSSHSGPDGSGPGSASYNPDIDPTMNWDYDKLLQINPDCIGYIRTRGEQKWIVDYPVVQCDDNETYLYKLFDGTYNNAGTLFMDYACKDGFESTYAIIYGHNMASGSRMFGYLKNYEKIDYFNLHPEMDVYVGYKHYIYKVFSVIVCGTSDYPYACEAMDLTGESTDSEREKAVNDLASYAISESIYDTGVKMNAFSKDSKILTLSTCYGDYSDPRRLVVIMVRDREVDHN